MSQPVGPDKGMNVKQVKHQDASMKEKSGAFAEE
jgi:hypothetical protein